MEKIIESQKDIKEIAQFVAERMKTDKYIMVIARSVEELETGEIIVMPAIMHNINPKSDNYGTVNTLINNLKSALESLYKVSSVPLYKDNSGEYGSETLRPL